jgi:uncharacterized protein (TIGR03435 family)
MTARMRPAQKLRNSLVVTALAAIGLAVPAHPQSGTTLSQSAQVNTFAYDVVSVKPHQAGDESWSSGPSQDGYRAVNVTAPSLIQYAYVLTLPDQISGLPGWAADARFDIEAKMDEQTVAEFRKLSPEQQQEQRQLMMQTVLADRFKLKVHRETNNHPIYELVVAKSGCKLKESPAGEPQRMMIRNGRIVSHAVPVFNMISNLSYETGRIVVDKTGLTGDYDFTLNWTPEEQSGTDGAGPSIFTALEEQLGLKLVPAMGPVDTIVVDRIEQPSPN